MANLPVVNSQVQIQRIEVWVTNRTGATTDARDIVGLMDLGEPQPFNPNVHSSTISPLPANGANDLSCINISFRCKTSKASWASFDAPA